VTGIHTEVGKTVVATAIAKGLGWPYWKPIQTGVPRDSEIAAECGLSVIIPPLYSLAMPAAPLVAAQLEGASIDWHRLCEYKPQTSEPLVIEGAGGLFVPITEKYFFIDLFAAWKLPVILTIRPYLGAMNHTWLSLHAIESYGLPLIGVVLTKTNGDPSEAYFRETFAELLLGEIPDYGASLPPPDVIYEAIGLAKTLPSRISV